MCRNERTMLLIGGDL